MQRLDVLLRNGLFRDERNVRLARCRADRLGVVAVVLLTPWSESRRGAVTRMSVCRFPSPLIKPDMQISRIRLSDWLHHKAHAGDLSRPRQRHSTLSSA